MSCLFTPTDMLRSFIIGVTLYLRSQQLFRSHQTGIRYWLLGLLLAGVHSHQAFYSRIFQLNLYRQIYDGVEKS